MSVGRIAAALGLLAFFLAVPLAAQGLGDVAAREKAKRKAEKETKKEPAKEFTNQDLDAGRPPGSKPEGDSTGAQLPTMQENQESSSESEPREESSESNRREQERALVEAVSAAQQGVTQAETRIRSLAEKLNPMSTSYIYGVGGSNDANEELRIRNEMRQAERELEAARQSVVTATQRLEAFRQGRAVARPD